MSTVRKSYDIAATDPARGSSLMSIKMAQKAKEEDDKNKTRRRKAMIVQVLQFLQDHGLHRTYDAMVAETNMNLQKYSPADNMDLTSIFTEYEDFVEYKMGKRPVFFRVNKDYDENANNNNTNSGPSSSGGVVLKNKPGTSSPCLPPVAPPPNSNNNNINAASKENHNNNTSSSTNNVLDIRGVQATTTGTRPGISGNNNNNAPGGKRGFVFAPTSGTNSREHSDDDESGSGLPGFQGRSALLKPLPHFPTQDLQELAGMIHREILDRDPGVSFSDIAELDKAKQLLIEACVMPAKYPQFFTGILRPWKGVLLAGPPGTGKTMLAKAVSSECRTTFFNISASSIVTKYRGESERLVRMLFELALHFAPSTIFIDELDSVLSARTSDGSEHEASRRMKTEFLVQMDGLAKRSGGDNVFVLAASNLPWDLDAAVLRRLEKRIMVDLPGLTAREKMFRRLLTNTSKDFDFTKCAEITEGYSGADIDVLCREAMMRSVRILIKKLESKHEPLSNAPLSKLPMVTLDDVIESAKATRASVQSIPAQKYREWEAKFGSTISDEAIIFPK